MWREYWSEYYPGRTSQERKAMSDKYWKKAIDVIAADPVDYIRWRFFKMWYVWQKENFFFYKEPGFADHRQYIYAFNLVFLMLGAVGMAVGWKQAKAGIGKWLLASFVGTILYGTIAFCFSHAEYRLTIPFYPIVYSLAAMGVVYIAAAARKVVQLWK